MDVSLAEGVTGLAVALIPLNPHLRGAPLGLPFRWGRATIQRALGPGDSRSEESEEIE